MSDFDKEAEREKLRKKYARDEEKRAHTQRMSELLLQGATMTSSHCEQCGDPLFRHNGQTFCASCQAENGDQSTTTNAATTAENTPVDDPSTVEADDADTAAGDVAADGDTAASPAADGDTAGTNTTPSRNPTTPNHAHDAATPAGSNPVSNIADSASPADLTAARQSLERTVARFASRAESTDDPRRARELLAAAREAADTLDALD